MKLAVSGDMRSQNLQLTRFLAAVGVICSHAFSVATGSGEGEWLLQLTKGKISVGSLAVAIFFLCGGYLAGKSVEHAQTCPQYFKARLWRILPALVQWLQEYVYL